MIDVKENEDGTFTISWDENDPQESLLNYWTEQDFINALTNYLDSLKESGVVDNSIDEKLTESIEQISEFFFEDYEDAYENYIQASYEVSPYYIDQTAEEVNQDINTLNDWYSVKKDAIDEYLKETNIETYGDQGTEQSQSRPVPPPNFPLFP